jgi:hypothetical protein
LAQELRPAIALRLRGIHPAWWVAAALMAIVLAQSWVIARKSESVVTLDDATPGKTAEEAEARSRENGRPVTGRAADTRDPLGPSQPRARRARRGGGGVGPDTRRRSACRSGQPPARVRGSAQRATPDRDDRRTNRRRDAPKPTALEAGGSQRQDTRCEQRAVQRSRA